MKDSPVSVYGESKQAGEVELLKHGKRYEVVIIRPPIVYGPKDWNFFVLIKAVSKRLLPRFSSASSDGEKYYSVIHSEDLVQAIHQAGKVESSKIRSGEVFYVSSGERITQTQLIDEMARNLGVKAIRFPLPTIILYPVAAALTLLGMLLRRSFSLNLDKLNEIRADYWVCSNEKARQKLQFVPRYSFPEGMRNTIQWYRDHQWLK
jgi:nucleoside-diphosphate-sugar epimerase